MTEVPGTKMARTSFKAGSGDVAPIRSLPSEASPPARFRVWAWPAWRYVGVAFPEALSLDMQKGRPTQAQSGFKICLPAPSPMAPPRSPGLGGAGPGVQRPLAGEPVTSLLVVSARLCPES